MRAMFLWFWGGGEETRRKECWTNKEEGKADGRDKLTGHWTQLDSSSIPSSFNAGWVFLPCILLPQAPSHYWEGGGNTGDAFYSVAKPSLLLALGTNNKQITDTVLNTIIFLERSVCLEGSGADITHWACAEIGRCHYQQRVTYGSPK